MAYISLQLTGAYKSIKGVKKHATQVILPVVCVSLLYFLNAKMTNALHLLIVNMGIPFIYMFYINEQFKIPRKKISIVAVSILIFVLASQFVVAGVIVTLVLGLEFAELSRSAQIFYIYINYSIYVIIYTVLHIKNKERVEKNE